MIHLQSMGQIIENFRLIKSVIKLSDHLNCALPSFFQISILGKAPREVISLRGALNYLFN
jgi:hypothetical protein